MKDHESQFLFFRPLLLKYRILLLDHCFQWIFIKFAWLDGLNKGTTRQQWGKIGNNSSANVGCKICEVFANDYCITFTGCLESRYKLKHILIIAAFALQTGSNSREIWHANKIFHRYLNNLGAEDNSWRKCIGRSFPPPPQKKNRLIAGYVTGSNMTR